MTKSTTIHGVLYSIKLEAPGRCLVTKYGAKKQTAKTTNTKACYYILNKRYEDRHARIDAERHLYGLFLT